MATQSNEQKEDTKADPDDAQRKQWKVGSKVQIYSDSKSKWMKAEIIKVFNDDKGEWLEVKYAGSTKEIQRYNQCIKPFQNKKKKRKRNTQKSINKQPCKHRNTASATSSCQRGRSKSAPGNYKQKPNRWKPPKWADTILKENDDIPPWWNEKSADRGSIFRRKQKKRKMEEEKKKEEEKKIENSQRESIMNGGTFLYMLFCKNT